MVNMESMEGERNCKYGKDGGKGMMDMAIMDGKGMGMVDMARIKDIGIVDMARIGNELG